jgi:hypothetical protein
MSRSGLAALISEQLVSRGARWGFGREAAVRSRNAGVGKAPDLTRKAIPGLLWDPRVELDPPHAGRELATFDSRLEERVAKDFRKAAPDWDVVSGARTPFFRA